METFIEIWTRRVDELFRRYEMTTELATERWEDEGGSPRDTKREMTTFGLRVKVFAIDNRACTVRIMRRPSGRSWDSVSVDATLGAIAADLRRRFPGNEYKIIRIGPLAFNFVFVGPREVPAERMEDGAPDVGVQNGKQSEE